MKQLFNSSGALLASCRFSRAWYENESYIVIYLSALTRAHHFSRSNGDEYLSFVTNVALHGVQPRMICVSESRHLIVVPL